MAAEDPFGLNMAANEIVKAMAMAIIVGGSVIFAAGALVGALAVLLLM